MRSERLEQDDEITHHNQRLLFPGHRFINKYHQSRDGCIESHAIQIFSHLFDAGMKNFELRRRRLYFHDGLMEPNSFKKLEAAFRLSRRVLFEIGFTLLIHEQSPYASEETINTFHAL